MTDSVRRPLRRLNTRTRIVALAVWGCYAALPAGAADPKTVTAADLQKTGIGDFTATQGAHSVDVYNLASRTVATSATFHVLAGESFNIHQKAASDAFMVRVTGQDGVLQQSVIAGNVWSNGQFWLQNAAGTIIKPGAVIDVARFVATLGITDTDFLAGRLTFHSPSNGGKIVNQGTIKTPSGGSVYLVGADVSNEGVITTPQGETILAAGERVNLIDTGTPGVKVEITGKQGNVTNLGQILADAGRIGMVGALVRNSGVLNVSSGIADLGGKIDPLKVVTEGGRVFLKASQDAYVDGKGRIVATGTQGGRVEVLGQRVAVMDEAEIDASGARGGGTILVGGDYQGKNPDVQNAAVTYFGADARLKADATDQGDGGKIILWADDTTRAYGNISARGGANGGDGGFVETSGHRYIDYQGRTDLRASKGSVGTLLLDPSDVTIDDSASDTLYGGTGLGSGYFGFATDNAVLTWSTIESQLSLGNFEVWTNSAGAGGSGNINVNTSHALASSNTLALKANNDIIFANGINVSSPGSMDLVAGWNSTGSAVNSGTGTVSFGTNTTFSAASLWINVGNSVSVGSGANVSTSGSLQVAGGVGIATGGMTVASGATVSSGGSMSLGSSTSKLGGDIMVAGTLTSGGSAQDIYTTGSIQVMGTDSGPASITYTGTGTQTVSGDAGITVGGNIGATSGGSAKIASASAQVIKTLNTTLNVHAGSHATNTSSNFASIQSVGAQSIDTGIGSISILGGGVGTGSDNYASISSSTGSQTITAGALTLTGGSSGDGNYAQIRAGGSQTFTLSGNLAMTGGGGGSNGINDFASIEAGTSNAAATQTFLFVGGGATVSLQGGSSAGTGGYADSACGAACTGYTANSGARIRNAGSGQQKFDFQSGSVNQMTLTGGSGGGGNDASIDAEGSQWIGSSVASISRPTIALTGGASGGTVIAQGGKDYYMGNSAELNADNGQDIFATSITMDGGSASFGGAFIGGGPRTELTITGGLTMTTSGAAAGSHTDSAGTNLNEAFVHKAAAAIGDKNDTSVTITAGGAINLSGSNTATSEYGGSPVLIGSLTGKANVNITGSGINVTATANGAYGSTVMIGSYPGAGGNVAMNGGAGNVALGAAYVASGSGAADSVTVTTSGAVSQTSGGKIAATTVNINAGSVAQPVGAAIAASILRASGAGTLSFLGNNMVGQTFVSGTGNLEYNAVGAAQLMLDSTVSATPTLKLTSTDTLSVYKSGNLTLGAGSNLDSGTADMMIAASGDLSYAGANLLTQGSLLLGAGNNLDIGSELIPPSSSLGLTAGNALNISAAVETSGDVVMMAPTIHLTTGGSVYGTDVGIVAGNLTATGGSIDASHNVAGAIAGNVELNEGSYIRAGNDVALVFAGADSTLSLNDGVYGGPSYILAGVPMTISLNFLGRSSGGIVINGVETTTSVPGGSGLFATSHNNPAVEGAGLELKYAAPVVTGATPAPTATIIDAINNAVKPTTPTNNVTPPPPPPPGSGNTLSSPDGQTAGGGTGQFGGDTTDSGDSGGSSGSSGSGDKDKKDDKKSSDASGDQKDDKSGSRKSVGKCSA